MPNLTEEKKLEKYNKLVRIAKRRGGKPLFKEWPGSKTKALWKCGCGHEWRAAPNNVANGSWCPNCSSGLSERICRDLFERMFDRPFKKIRPEWLVIDGKRLELDGYCESLMLAFEHNGTQHYQNGLFCFDLETRKRYDNAKIELCKKNGVTLVVIPALFTITPLNKLTCLIRDSVSCNIPHPEVEPMYISGILDFQKQLEAIQKIAIDRGGRCTSAEYKGWNKKLEFSCQCGYVWKATPNSIKNGTWCPRCAGRPVIKLDDLNEIARLRGGELISTKYSNNHEKLTWKCEHGHIWKASYNCIQKHWCPRCSVKTRSQKRKLGIEAYQKAALKKGGRCLSTSVAKCYDKLEFECAFGHRWFGRADQIKNTKQWCPKCANAKRTKNLQRY